MVNIRNELEKLRNEVWHILQMDYSKRTGFIPSILGGIDGILEIPKRNCDIGTVEEQYARFCTYLEKNSGKSVLDLQGHYELTAKCFAIWAQMPYESEVK